ncbi:MAG: phage tail sheath family protein [Bacteroidales bacterium]|nr:phage tail sheath family protein [Bacteroidales bacterium]
MGAKTLYAYRLNSGGVKASNDYATALYSGVRGNDLKTVIQVNADDSTKYDVATYLGTVKVDEQTVASAGELTANDYVTFRKDAALAETVGTPFTGGTNGEVDGAAHQKYLDLIENYTFNTMGAVVTDTAIKKLYVAFVKRMRDELGIKFQCVLYNIAADFMGVIGIKNKVTDEGWSEASLVYWVTGAECGCEVNKSCQNRKYNGSFSVAADYTQSQLEAAIKAGEFTFHKVSGDIRVLEDINTMVTTSDTQGDIFKDNQTIRVIDQLGNDDAILFKNKYLGVVPNNASGRTSLWSDIVKIRQQLQDIGAIESFNDSDVTVAQGDTKKAVVVTSAVTVVNAMSKLYMTVTVA